jgi:hypothetical protein
MDFMSIFTVITDRFIGDRSGAKKQRLKKGVELLQDLVAELKLLTISKSFPT